MVGKCAITKTLWYNPPMIDDKFEAIRIIGALLFFWIFISLLPSKKKATKNQKKTTTTPRKMKSPKPGKKNTQKSNSQPTTTFGDTSGWHEDEKPKISFFRNKKSNFYVDESVDYEASFDVGGRRKNPPQGFDR